MTALVRWIVYGFVAAAAAAIVVFPTPEPVGTVGFDPMVRALNEARMRWTVQSELLRRKEARAFAREAASRPAASPVSAAYEIVLHKGVPASFEGAVRQRADRFFDDLPRQDSSVRVIIALMLDTTRATSDVPLHRTNWRLSADIFPPDSSTRNACVVVLRAMNQRALIEPPATVGADACYWYKAYGAPGHGVATLIDSTRGSLIAERGRRTSHYLDDPLYFRFLMGSDSRMLRCASGDRRVCARIISVTPDGREDVIGRLRTPGWIGYGRYYSTFSDLIPATLLRRIEREVGPDVFHQIWKSDAPFAEAFAEARGIEFAEWVHDLIVERAPPYRSGPMPSPRTWLMLAIAIPGLIGLAAYGTSRRAGVD
jgi:hypothetical protein